MPWWYEHLSSLVCFKAGANEWRRVICSVDNTQLGTPDCVYFFVNDNKRQACWVVNQRDKIFVEWRGLLEINSYFSSSDVLAKWTDQ